MNLLSQIDLDDLIRRALAEDVGQGDITTAATVPSNQPGSAAITVKESGFIIFCGGPILSQVFQVAGARPLVESCVAEGSRLEQGVVAAKIEGLLAGLLIGERVALNFVQLMSGIATATRRYVDAVAGTGAKIVDTRKTHPGLRAIEKYAVRCGGGRNHRFGLDSGVLIKDNHIAAAGSIREALDRARALAPHTFRIEIECETLAQVEQAIAHGAASILLDNMSLGDLRQARKVAGKSVVLEASGGITLDTVRAIAETGVDLISVGALTHSPKAVDLSMRIEATL
ncbi:MAG TPA: carboxylating nicotinate-nucleotide diphosphorylase [Candidatus Binataceae bacterium]|nr:carboxylating nicotinate-nucleotide diphosphorylase [Candidatus Binataceae bacterium]